MINIILLVDLDCTTVMFLEELCSRYNKMYGKNLHPDDITEWSLHPFMGDEGIEIFKQPGFFFDLKPYPYAIDVLKNLHQEEFEILIATDCLENLIIQQGKQKWLDKYLPFIPKDNIYFTNQKHLIYADLIVDDAPKYINNFPGYRVIWDKPYNRNNVRADYRIYENDWLEFYWFVNKLKAEKYYDILQFRQIYSN